MKKKKLKQRIRELESEIGQVKSNEEIWKDMVYRFVDELKGYGVKVEIIPAKPPIIEAFSDEDMCTRYVYGKTTELPTLSFDFSEHDKRIRSRGRSEEEYKLEIKELEKYNEFLDKENKCFIYITNFFASPMIYDAIGIGYTIGEIPIVKIKYVNGEEDEVNITELMEYDTLEKCEKRCEVLNKEMEDSRNSWNNFRNSFRRDEQ